MKPNLIKIALSACFLLIAVFTISPAIAQNKADMFKNSTPEQRAQTQTKFMKTKLQLDTVQVVKIQAINLTAAQKMEPVLKGDGGKLAKFKQMREIESNKDKDFKNVLTPDQYKQYEAFKEEMKQKMMEKAKAAKS